ncbi:MAG: hypothetical protein LBM61_05080 [Prevotellaceae bacterium]|jgi:hypothetical protein|nr:hypothetical protein [Prevotellaceae bacterium]
MKALPFIICILCCVFACQSKQRTDAEAIVREWMGKEIRFPELTGDTARVLDSLLTKEYKVLFYVDSTGCTKCKLNLGVWAGLIEESKRQLSDKVGFVFFFQAKNQRTVKYLLDREYFEHPVFMDQRGKLNKRNALPTQPAYQCFLLDRDNKVLMIGNPADIPSVWELYKRVITQQLNE